ncbi:helix-turn-helix domain-containing protein [Tepidibacillus infernus]|uniref:helix-turn-helix domain-containing protein n=1 Tax=Tepidibacillus TaxID=1494427 RepID=UPI001F1FFBC4|nr:helix-turn-helix domain-containing protein [Tepidibacillus decaturensis]
MNPTYLSRKFTEELEMNYIDYLNHYRIEKAKQILIQYPDKPIAWIADEVGFSSQHHFNHMFRKWTNRTPSQYRKSYK